MSYAYFALYQRLIARKSLSEEEITIKVDDAYNKGRLTEAEYRELVDFIAQMYQ